FAGPAVFAPPRGFGAAIGNAAAIRGRSADRPAAPLGHAPRLHPALTVLTTIDGAAALLGTLQHGCLEGGEVPRSDSCRNKDVPASPKASRLLLCQPGPKRRGPLSRGGPWNHRWPASISHPAGESIRRSSVPAHGTAPR